MPDRRSLLSPPPDDDPPPAPSTPVRKSIGIAPYAAVFGGQGGDLLTTALGLSREGGRETNPIGATPVVASKVALMAAVPLLMRYLEKHDHPTLAKVLGYGVGGAGAVPAAWNIHQLTK